MKVLYFAWLRTRIGMAAEPVDLPAAITDVAGLVEHLRDLSAGHRAAFADLDAVRVAVNQEYVGWDHPVDAADEVAFFPPVTGG